MSIVKGKTFPWLSVPDNQKEKSDCLKTAKKTLEDFKARGMKSDELPYRQLVEIIGLYSK